MHKLLSRKLISRKLMSMLSLSLTMLLSNSAYAHPDHSFAGSFMELLFHGVPLGFGHVVLNSILLIILTLALSIAFYTFIHSTFIHKGFPMKKILFSVISLLICTPAYAHHPLAGMSMETFFHGLLSGVGHPLLGFDHLFFIALVGVASVLIRKRLKARLLAPAAYLCAMLVGCLLMYFGTDLPAKEVVIGLSLLTLGVVVLSGRALKLLPAMGLFAVFGLFHGSAFGDAIVREEAAIGTLVLMGYLIGLGVIQYLIILLSGWVTEHFWKVATSNALQPRLAGAMVAGVGLFLTLENIEAPLLSALF